MTLNNFNTTNWMSNIQDTRKINSLVIPGSHDTGMSELHHCDVFSKCHPGMVQTQDISIYDQLRAGARYFDIRIDYDHEFLVTYHRTNCFGCNGQKLEKILEESINFLKLSKKEMLILKFSHIRSDRGMSNDIKDRIENFLNNSEYTPFIYISNDPSINLSEITIRECRGKIIMVFDYPEFFNEKTGRFQYIDLDEKLINTTNFKQNFNLAVFDKYSNTADYDEMMNDQLYKLNKYGGLNDKHLFLLSWTLTLGAKSIFKTIKQITTVAHIHLPAVLKNQYDESKPLPNIVYIDFINENICKEIIKYN